MQPTAGIGITWLGLILLVFVGFMIVKGLANPGSRPLVLGLLLFGLLAFMFVGVFSLRAVRMPAPPNTVVITEAAPLPPGYFSKRSTEAVRPRNTRPSAAATKSDHASRTAKPIAPDKTPKPSTPPIDTSDDPALEPAQPPDWVKAEPGPQGDVYLMTRQTGPYTTLLECEREIPKAVQGAVSEYAQLALGVDQAKYVQLPESDLRRLERQRWVEKRQIEIDGEQREMRTLHLLIGFDQAMQRQIHTMAENALVVERVKAENEFVTARLEGAGVVLGGVLTLLALVWGGLSLAAPKQCTNAVPATPAPAAGKARTWSVVSIVSLACLVAGILAIITLALFVG